MKKTATFLISLASFFAGANSIPINNANLEAQVLSDGDFVIGQIQGWETVHYASGAGVYNPSATALPSEAGSGEHGNTLWLNSGALVKQDLNVPFTANTVYTLQFDIADRIDNDISNYTIRFKAGSTTVYNITNPHFPTEGNFENVVLSFDSGNTSYAGELLSLEIETPSNNVNKQINVDNFQLTYEQTSVPAAFGEMLYEDPNGSIFTLNTWYFAETDLFAIYRNNQACSNLIEIADISTNVDNPDSDYDPLYKLVSRGSMVIPVAKGEMWRIRRHTNPNSSCTYVIRIRPVHP